jgi:hypothetical protein
VTEPPLRAESVLRLTEVLRPLHPPRPEDAAGGCTHDHFPNCCQIATALRGGPHQNVREIENVQSGRQNPGLSSPASEDRLYSSLRKGGDPAAGSPTATLLRLRPSHCARLRRLGPLRVPTPTSGAHSFHGVTGGVYKARERIHRGVADPRLLAIPASCRRVADDNPN